MGYVVRKSTGTIVFQRDVIPIDELRILERGVASSSTVSESSTQTDESRVEDEQPPAPGQPLRPWHPLVLHQRTLRALPTTT